MESLPDHRRTPRQSVQIASDLFGRDHVVQWCEELLAGSAVAGDKRFPDITWLRVSLGWPDYWSRVWGARGLLHLGMPLNVQVVRGALRDPLVDDPVARVRGQAWRALGRAERI